MAREGHHTSAHGWPERVRAEPGTPVALHVPTSTHAINPTRSEKQPPQLRTRIFSPHERLTHQKTVNPVLQHQLHIGTGKNPALGHRQTVRRYPGQQL